MGEGTEGKSFVTIFADSNERPCLEQWREFFKEGHAESAAAAVG